MSSKIKKIVFNTLAGFLLCVIVGFLFYGADLFAFKDSRTQIIIYGLAGSLFFSVLKYKNIRETIFIGVTLFVLNVLIIQGRNITLNFVIRDLVIFFMVFYSLWLYNLFIKKYSKIPLFIRGIGLALLMVVSSIISTTFAIMLFNIPFSENYNAVLLNAFYSAIIGISLAIGFDLYEKYENKIISFAENVV